MKINITFCFNSVAYIIKQITFIISILLFTFAVIKRIDFLFLNTHIMRTIKFIFISLLLLSSTFMKAQTYKDSKLPTETRVQDLLKRMTIDEKFWQLFMLAEDLKLDKSRYVNGAFGFEGNVSEAEGNIAGQMIKNEGKGNAEESAEVINKIQKYFIEKTRLGIPVIIFDEALHGLVREGATSFPQSIGLAASFDTDLMHKVSKAIAIETKSRGIRQILSPVINIASDVRWGRVEETYGEDPFLSAKMSVAFVSEFEKLNVITTPKHFIANVGDGGRDSYPIHFNERLLDEIYFPPFKESFQVGGSRSVMSSYNSLDGAPCTPMIGCLIRNLGTNGVLKVLLFQMQVQQVDPMFCIIQPKVMWMLLKMLLIMDWMLYSR